MTTPNSKTKAKPASQTEAKSSSTRRMPWVAIGVITSIVIVVAMLLTVMPKGFKSTHEQIGTGKPALVFVYDPNLAVSGSQTEQMNEVRASMNSGEEQMFFLIAQIGTPDGDKLITKHRARQAELLLFDPTGSLIKRDFAFKSASDITQWVR